MREEGREWGGVYKFQIKSRLLKIGERKKMQVKFFAFI